MADDQEEEAVGVSVELVLSQLPLDRVHTLAGQVPVDLHLESLGTQFSLFWVPFVIMTYVPQHRAHDLYILLGWLLLLVEVVEDDGKAEPGPVHVVVEVLLPAHVSVLLLEI